MNPVVKVEYTTRYLETQGHLDTVVLVQRTITTPRTRSGSMLYSQATDVQDWEITIARDSVQAMVAELVSALAYFAGPEAEKDRA